eukprot:3332683-Rhodomonas_salina.2
MKGAYELRGLTEAPQRKHVEEEVGEGDVRKGGAQERKTPPGSSKRSLVPGRRRSLLNIRVGATRSMNRHHEAIQYSAVPDTAAQHSAVPYTRRGIVKTRIGS